jgi:hypothetical protein
MTGLARTAVAAATPPHRHPNQAVGAPASLNVLQRMSIEAMSRSWSRVFALAANSRPTQRSSEKSRAANSLRTPPLVVVCTPQGRPHTLKCVGVIITPLCGQKALKSPRRVKDPRRQTLSGNQYRNGGGYCSPRRGSCLRLCSQCRTPAVTPGLVPAVTDTCDHCRHLALHV